MARRGMYVALLLMNVVSLEGFGAGKSAAMDSPLTSTPNLLGWAFDTVLLHDGTRNRGDMGSRRCTRGFSRCCIAWYGHKRGSFFLGSSEENFEDASRRVRVAKSETGRISRSSHITMRGGRHGHGHGHGHGHEYGRDCGHDGNTKIFDHAVMDPITSEIGDGRTIKVKYLQDPLDHDDILRIVDAEVSAGKELRYHSVDEAHAFLGHKTTQCFASSIVDAQGENRVVGAAFLVPKGGVRTSHTCEMVVIVEQSFRGLGVGSSLVEAALRASSFLGFEGISSGQTYVSNVAAVQLMRRHGFKLVGVEPRAAYLAGRRGATDAMVFYKDTREARRGGRARQVADAGEEDEESEHDLEMMVAAEELAAQAAEVGEVPVGAVVVSPEGKIIGKGRNSMVGSNNPCAHAEVLAIQDAASTVGNYRLEGCSIYVTLEPCAMCCGAMLHARIPRLVYAAREPKGGCAGSVLDLLSGGKFNHAVKVTGGVREEENAAVLSNFFRKRRRKGRL